MLRKLAGQTAVYGVSTIAAKLLNFLLAPYLVRVLTTSEYGVVGDLYAIIPFVLVLLTMGMETGYFKFAAQAQNAEQRKNVFQTTWGAVTILSVIFFCVVLIFYKQLAEVMKYAETPSFVLIVASLIVMDAIYALPFAKLREEGKAVKYMLIKFMSVVITVILTVFFYSVMPNIDALSGFIDKDYMPIYYPIANLVSSIVVLLALYPSYKGFVPKVDTKQFRIIFIYSLPLLVSGVAGMANEFLDRQFIKYMLPENVALSSVGIYSGIAKLAVIMTLFVQMYRLAAEPFFLSNFKKEDFLKINAEAMKYFIIVSVAIFLVITLFSDVFGLLLGDDYMEGMYILPIILLANILFGIVLNLSFWYKQTGKTKFAIVINGSGLVSVIILNLTLIPIVGYMGAAWARLGCEAVMVTVSYCLVRKYYPIPYDFKRIGAYLLLGAVLYGIGMAATAMNIVINTFVNLMLILTFVLYVVRVEKINVKLLIKSLLKR